VAVTVPVMDVALSRSRRLCGGRLRLPMKECGRNRIVLVERGRRILAFGLFERHKKQVRVRRLVSHSTGLLPRGLVEIQYSKRGEYVVDRVARMYGQGHSDRRSSMLGEVERIGEMLRSLVQQWKQLAQLLDNGRMRVNEFDRLGECLWCDLRRDHGEVKAGHKATIGVRQPVHRRGIRKTPVGVEPKRIVHVEDSCQAIA